MFINLNLKTVKVGFAFVAAIALVIGLIWNLNDFITNFLAGVVGLSLGIIVTLSIVNKAVEEFNDTQWVKIRNSAYKSMINDISLVAFLISIKLPIAGLKSIESFDLDEIKRDNEKLLAELPNELKNLSTLIPQIITSSYHETATEDGLSVTDDDVKRILNTAFEDIKPLLNGFRYIRIPRIMQSPKNQEIKDALIEFDGFIDLYYYHMGRFNRENADLSRAIWTTKSLKNLIDKALQLSNLLNAIIDNATDAR